jgi:hypothetical protein
VCDANHTCQTLASHTGGLFVKEPDLALSARVGNTCLMAFRGTTTDIRSPTFFKDWEEDLQQKQVPFLGNCTITKGIYGAYYASFSGELEDSVRLCMSSCPHCNLLITGISQGGSIANMAGVLFESYGFSPYVVTFAQPKVLGFDCLLNPWRWYRFIHAVPGLLRLQYDIVPMVAATGTFYGHEIVVSSDDSSGVDYVGLKHVEKYPWNIGAHYHEGYIAAVNAVRNNGYPIRINGFRSGSKCSVDEECESGKCGWRWLMPSYKCT